MTNKEKKQTVSGVTRGRLQKIIKKMKGVSLHLPLEKGTIKCTLTMAKGKISFF